MGSERAENQDAQASMSLDKRIERLKKECVGKVRYGTEKIAGIVAKSVWKERKVHLRIYACGICAGFHLTRLNAEVVGKIKAESKCKFEDCENDHQKDKDFCRKHKPREPDPPLSAKNKCKADGCEKKKCKHTRYCVGHMILLSENNSESERRRLIDAGILKPNKEEEKK